jgi:dipeptidyl-peptidase-4
MRVSLVRSAFLALLLAIGPVWAAKKPVTIHDVVTAHPASIPSPNWRPDGQAFAYEENGRVWLYDVAARNETEWFDADKLTKKRNEIQPKNSSRPFNWQNRRVDTSGMQWFPDGKSLLVPAPGGLFVINAGNAKPKETIADIREDNVPTLSPDGRSVLFRKDSNLFVRNLASRKTAQLTSDGTSTLLNGQLDWVYPEELDLGTAFWWSPDSKWIAYMQFDVSKEFIYPHSDLLGLRAIYEPQRYPQAGTPNAEVKVGVVSVDGGPTTWMQVGDTANTLIVRVNWLPDSRALGIQRMNRIQNCRDFLLADAASGSVRTVLSERDKFWINTDDDLRFLSAKPDFVWSSERSGFRHLYLYSEDGKLLRQLTSGNWQVNKVIALNEETGYVYYTSTEASPLQDQLYRVSLKGGAPERLSRSSGMHAIFSDEHGRNYLDTFSSLTSPPQSTLHNGSGAQLAVFRSADRTIENEYQILPEEAVTVHLKDGTILYAHLIKPYHFEPDSKYPAIVFIYAGPQAQVNHDAWGGISWEQALADRGFVIWKLDNRGSVGRGHLFESPVYREMGRVELSDQRAGIEKLLSMGFVDKDRIGIYGWSYGGYMTLYSLLHAPDLFKAGIAGAPVTDWHNYDTIYTERYMGLPSENPEGYKKSSDVLAAGDLQSKLMIVCNFEDDNVLFQNTMQMMSALRRANKQFEFMLYPQKTHGVTGDLREPMLEQMTEFFERNLKGNGK